jgi:hypothetical protein
MISMPPVPTDPGQTTQPPDTTTQGQPGPTTSGPSTQPAKSGKPTTSTTKSSHQSTSTASSSTSVKPDSRKADEKSPDLGTVTLESIKNILKSTEKHVKTKGKDEMFR